MILTVTLNAAVDRVYAIPAFSLNCVNRPVKAKVFAGGKGINVARVVNRLGGTVTSTGLLGGNNGQFVLDSMINENLDTDFEIIEGETRVCIAAVDTDIGNQTEINEAGPKVSASELSRFRGKLSSLLNSRRYEYLVLSGSIPHGVPTDFYAECILLARRCDVKSILDASGEPFQAGVAAKPWMIKPNQFELSGLLDSPMSNTEDVVQAAKNLVGTGIGTVCVTRGGEAAILAAKDSCIIARPPVVKYVSAVGSGDSFVGAFLWKVMNGCGKREAFLSGLAAGAANAERYGSGFIDQSDLERLSRYVEIV